MNQRHIIWSGIALLVILTVLNTWFVVVQTQQAIVFQFRNVVEVIDKPGLHFKIPVHPGSRVL